MGLYGGTLQPEFRGLPTPIGPPAGRTPRRLTIARDQSGADESARHSTLDAIRIRNAHKENRTLLPDWHRMTFTQED